MSVQSDETLIQMVAAGGPNAPAAFDELYDRHFPRTIAFLQWVHRLDYDDAAFVAEDAWVSVLQSAPRFDRTKRFTTWLYTIAKRKSIDRHRRAATAGDAVPLDSVAYQLVAHNSMPTEQDLDLRRAIERLCEEDRQLVWHRFVEGRTEAEIAEVLDMPLGSVHGRLLRCLNELRAHFGLPPAS
jgi:RNA polymerase sigma-70 factor (ECF subfamily)